MFLTNTAVCCWQIPPLFLGLYWRVMVLDIVTYSPLFGVVTLICTYLVSEAYKKTKISLKHKWEQCNSFLCSGLNLPFVCCHSRISLRREGAVSKEVLGDISASGKKLSKAEKDERYTLTLTLTQTHTLVLFPSGCRGRRMKWQTQRQRLLPSSTTTLSTSSWCYFCSTSCVPSTQPCIHFLPSPSPSSLPFSL